MDHEDFCTRKPDSGASLLMCSWGMQTNIDGSDQCQLPKGIIIEDDPDLREETSIMLTSAGIPNITACDATEALRLLRANKSVLALLIDIVMPGMNGLDLLVAVRSAFRSADAVEAVIMSAYIGTQFAQHPALSMAVGLLTKPAKSDEICSLLLIAMEKSVATRAATTRGMVGAANVGSP